MDLLAFILAISADGITDEQVQTALNAYIAEHPEAVTTVTDGSITKAKLDSNLQATVDDVGVLKSAIGGIRQTTKNLFDKTVFDNASGITLGVDGYYQGTVNAFRDAFSALFPIDGTCDADTRYTLSCKYYFTDVTGTYTGSSLTFKAKYTDETDGNLIVLGANRSTPITSSGTTAASKTVDHFVLIRADSRAANYVLHIKDVQVEEGTTATEYVGHYTADDQTKIPYALGSENAGKLLIVNDNGIVEPTSNPITIDTTLSNSGEAADAKTTGDKIGKLFDALSSRIINPTYELIKLPVVSEWSTTFQNFFEFGNEIWFCTASTAFGGDNHNGIVFRVNKNDYSYIGKFNHNLGHMAQVDYDAKADRIMLCNTESSSEPKIYIFHDVSEWPDIIAENGQLTLDDLTYDTIDLAALRASHMQLLYAITCWAERQPDGNRLVVGEGTHGAQWFKLMLGMGTNNLGEGTYVAAEDGRFNGSYKTLWYKTCEFTEIAGRDTPQGNQGLICYKGKFYEGLGHQPSYGGIYTPLISDYVHRDIYNLQMYLPDGSVYGGQSNTGGVSEGTNIVNGRLCVGISGYSDETYLVMMDI